MRIAAVLLIGAAACSGSDGEETPLSANVVVPSKDVLCQVWAADVVRNSRGEAVSAIYGTLDTDVVAAWGEPAERKGDVWIYEWCVGDCARKAMVTLTFERHDLCLGDEKISGGWLSDIEADGITSNTCWNGSLRNREPTCDGCLEKGAVQDCEE